MVIFMMMMMMMKRKSEMKIRCFSNPFLQLIFKSVRSANWQSHSIKRERERASERERKKERKTSPFRFDFNSIGIDSGFSMVKRVNRSPTCQLC